MPKGLRGYSTSFVRAIAHSGLSDLMFRFAHECVVREIPVSTISERLNVSRATVYAWFTGKVQPRKQHQEKIQQIMARWDRA